MLRKMLKPNVFFQEKRRGLEVRVLFIRSSSNAARILFDFNETTDPRREEDSCHLIFDVQK